MKRSSTLFALASCLTLGLAVLLAPSTALSLNETINCGDEVTAAICGECGLDVCFACVAVCCPDTCDQGIDPGCCCGDGQCDEVCSGGTWGFCCTGGVCNVINEPPPERVLPLHVTVALGTDKLSFQRKTGTKNNQTFVTFKLKEVFVSSVAHRNLTVTGMLTGADAGVGSLLYPVAFLDVGPNALDALHAHGYAVSIVGAAPGQTCQSVTSSTPACSLLANRLARLIDAALVASGGLENQAFEAGTQALGLPSCQGAISTTTTTTTSSTTSTTMCPTGLTNCSGTCVNLMNDNNNCGSCGNVCSTLPVCIGGVCTIP